EEVGVKVFGLQFKESFKDVLREFKNVERQTQFLSEIIAELRDTNNSLVTTNQNETMKILTVMVIITLPLSLIAAIFGMNSKNMPIIGSPHDFWIIIAVM